MANIEALKRSRKTERAAFTKAYNRVEELIALEGVDICELEAELNVFKRKVDRLDNTHSNILELLPEKEYDAEFEVVEDFRDKAVRIETKAVRIINGQQNDKTFGLKNKKGAKTQKFIQQVQHQVKTGNQSARKAELLKGPEKKKDEKKKEIDELNAIFRPVQKVEKGADPKSVLCAFYKQGQCTKGDKCKFSHDLNLERKSEKRNVYVDMRDNEEDLMENWDEEKLKEVVEKKHGENERKMPKTDIICKFFLDALENNKYGWFWECPNGANKCHYRHALPPGFVLKKDKKKEEKSEQISIEDLVEKERAQLGSTLTRITYETFQLWKKKKLKEKQEKNRKEEDRKRAEYKAGRHIGLSGRDMFTFNPEMATDDMTEEGEAAFDMDSREDDIEDNEPCIEISSEFLATELTNVEGGTVASLRHWEANQTSEPAAEGGDSDEEENKDAVPIDENLFDEDLDRLDEVVLNKRIKYRQQLINDIRKRFRSEYLGLLIQRKENKKQERDIKLGEVVLIGSDNVKCNDWPLGVVVKLLPGKDGINRLVRLRTAKGELLRPVQRIYPLEISNETFREDVLKTKSGRTVKKPQKLDL